MMTVAGLLLLVLGSAVSAVLWWRQDPRVAAWVSAAGSTVTYVRWWGSGEGGLFGRPLDESGL